MKSFILFILICLCSSSFTRAHVGISYPTGNEEFQKGEVITIKWYIAIEHGDCNWDLYFFPDNGNTWSDVSLDIAKSQLGYDWIIPDIATGVGKIRVVQDNLNGSDYSAESRAFTVTRVVSDVEAEDEQIKDFVIYPAYPNPFNSSTTISFNLPVKDFVALNIFNVSGQKVATLVNREMAAGLHRITWDADEVNSGVYFYVIQTTQAVQTRKLILIK
jgi:hypothetical protein